MVRLTEAENRAALQAAKKRGARVHGVLDPKSDGIVREEKRKQLAARAPVEDPAEPRVDITGEPMRSAGEVAQDAAEAGEGGPVGEGSGPVGAPSAGGGA